MSWYINYTLGYLSKKTGKIEPFGPYNSLGKLCDVISTSRLNTTDLKEYFNKPDNEELSDKLLEALDITRDKVDDNYLEVCPLDELPTDSYIKDGYYLIADVAKYKKDRNSIDNYDLEYSRLSSEEYTARTQAELTFGFKPELDEEGYQINHSMGEYMFFAYPNYNSKEYEADKLRTVAAVLDTYGYNDDLEKIIVIKTEG